MLDKANVNNADRLEESVVCVWSCSMKASEIRSRSTNLLKIVTINYAFLVSLP
jgi:hypothetical protein